MTTIKDNLIESQQLLIKQRLMYINIANELNTKQKAVFNESSDEDALTKNVVQDISGQLATTYFGLSDLNITADQLAEYMLHFSYDDKDDPLVKEIARKDALNAVANENFGTLTNADRDRLANDVKLFGASSGRSLKGQQAYRNASGDIDQLSGQKQVARREADHVIARSTWTAPDWMSESGKQSFKDIAESSDNFQMIDWKANRLKSDNRVYIDQNGQVVPVTYNSKQPEGTTDITSVATAKQRNEAFVGSIEKGVANAQKTIETSNNAKKVAAAKLTIQELEKNGYLDDDGKKINPKVSEQNLKNLEAVNNQADQVVLKDFGAHSFSRVTDAGKQVLSGHNVYDKNGQIKLNKRGKEIKRGGLKDMLIGQIVYYTIPPVIFEVKKNIKKGKSPESILKRIKKSLSKIGRFVCHKLRTIMANLSGNLLRNLVRTLLDTLVSALKGSLALIFKSVRDFMMAIMSSIKIIANPQMSGKEKGNAVVGLLVTTTIGLVINTLLNDIKIDWIQISLQIILTAVLSSLALKVLEKLDLFNLKYGFNVAKIRETFQIEINEFNQKSFDAAAQAAQVRKRLDANLMQLEDQTNTLKRMNYYSDSVEDTLNQINEQFDMKINFDLEWQEFVGL
ncbi:MAG TPA: hypothetical protein DEP42_07205 [Ruminococcaceae bacterium]|nr:hypothetical protein [Oscillospiraceae bacterium]